MAEGVHGLRRSDPSTGLTGENAEFNGSCLSADRSDDKLSAVLYSERHNLAFVHIHKTGGISLREFLRKRIRGMKEMSELPDAHYSVSQLYEALQNRGSDPADVRIITILRNPYAHALSIYTFWNSDAITLPERQLPTVSYARSHSFRDFLFNVLINDQYAPALLVNNELPFKLFVVKLETLAEDAQRVLHDELGLVRKVKVGRRNASDHGPYLEYYEPDMLAHVRRVYSWCFDAGYYTDE